MTDLYQINEISQAGTDDKPKVTPPNAGYRSDSNYLSTVNLFIKAIQKALDQVNRSVEIVDLTNEKANHELMTEFFSNLNLAKQIVEEFQKGTAILYEDTPELINLFNQLHEAFTIVKLKISIFIITKDKKHSAGAIQQLNNVLGVFQNMKKIAQEHLKLNLNVPEESSETTA